MGLSKQQRFELLVGPDVVLGSPFRSDAARRRAYFDHQDDLHEHLPPGRRPWAFWAYVIGEIPDVSDEPRLLAEYDLGLLRIAALAGFRFVGTRQLLDARYGDDLHLGLGLDFHVPRAGLLGKLHVLGELEASPFDRYLEARAALRIALSHVAIDAGWGIGTLDAPENPAYRVFAVLRYDR